MEINYYFTIGIMAINIFILIFYMEKIIKKQNFSNFGLTISILAFIVTIVNFIKNS